MLQSVLIPEPWYQHFLAREIQFQQQLVLRPVKLRAEHSRLKHGYFLITFREAHKINVRGSTTAYIA